MSRPEREQWGELRKFMLRVKTKYPAFQCFLKTSKLYVDNRLVSSCMHFLLTLNFISRMFVWDIEERRVKEQPIISIPTTAVGPMPKLNVQNR